MDDVGVIGLGRMGAAMARRLVACGQQVTLHNRTTQTAVDLAAELGGRVAQTAREAADRELVVVSLADDDAVLATHEGPDGIIAGMSPGTVVLETSTVDPRTIERLAAQVSAAGGELLDAPVSGSVSAVEAGSLTFMIGGPDAAIQRARSVLDALGARTFSMGGSGTGAAMKLAVNGVVHALNVALSEALVMAERSGIERTSAWDVFTSGAAGAPYVQYKRGAFLDPDDTPPAFTLDLVAKDLDLIVALAERLGIAAPQATTNRGIAHDAVTSGHAARDMSWLAEILRAPQA